MKGRLPRAIAVPELPYARRLAYIESSGTQHIDSGFTPNQDTRVVMKGTLLNQSANSSLFGARQSSSTKLFTMTWVNSSSYFLSYYGTGYMIVPFTAGTSFELDKNKNVTTLNGIVYEDAYETFTCPGSMYIFATNGNGSVMHLAPLRVEEMQIFDNGVLVRDFIPVLDFDGVACLFDKVEKKLYHNAGSGSFTYGEVIG